MFLPPATWLAASMRRMREAACTRCVLGPPMLTNLRVAKEGRALTPYQPQKRTLKLVSCGGRYAIAVWGGFSIEGAWVWRWKDRIDRQFVAAYSG